VRRYGRASRYRGGGGGGTVTPPAATPIVGPSTLDAMTVGPMTVANMRAMLGYTGTSYIGTGNLTNTSVAQATSSTPWGKSTRVFDQYLAAGTFGMPNSPAGNNGTGLALTTCPMPASSDRVAIEYDVCFLGSGRWPLGGKLPGIGGVRPGGGSVPTGGTQSANGFSCRLMHRRDNTNPTSGFLVGYLYDPLAPTDSYGTDLDTGRQRIDWNTVYRVRQEIEMNTVTTEGSKTPPENGRHRIYWNGALVYEDTGAILRLYSDVTNSHECFDLFHGGADSSWGADNDVHVQIDNYTVEALA